MREVGIMLLELLIFYSCIPGERNKLQQVPHHGLGGKLGLKKEWMRKALVRVLQGTFLADHTKEHKGWVPGAPYTLGSKGICWLSI